MRPLIWFRSDLRVDDNRALSAATRAATRGAVGVFLIAAQQWREHDWADAKVALVLRSLRSLSAELAKLNIALRVIDAPTFADAENALDSVALEHGCDALFFGNEYEVNERRRDDAVAEAWEGVGRRVFRMTDRVVVAPGAVRTSEGKWYTVFSPFERSWRRAFDEGEATEIAPAPKKQSEMIAQPGEVPASVEGFGQGPPAAAERWPGDADAVRSHLDEFCAGPIERYHDVRDALLGEGVSAISPYLALGQVSARRCVQMAMDGATSVEAMAKTAKKASGGKTKGRSKWINEIVWREFYQHLLVGFPRLSMHRPFRPEMDAVPWEGEGEAFDAWREGRTGFPVVDAAMRQLRELAWMHNRARMVVAMFLTKDLHIDWRLGERHFMRHLIDGDLGSNNGGWQWSASTGTDAQPYFRIFNPTLQSERHDADGAYIRRYVPELAGVEGKAIHDPSKLGDLELARLGYPAPIVDHRAARDKTLAMFEAAKAL